MSIKILDPEKDYVEIPLIKGGMAKAIIWPGMGAKYGSMHYFVMKPGEENVLHSHSNEEDMFYVVQGNGVIVDATNGAEHKFKKGDFVYVAPNIVHAVKSLGPEDFISVGGPSPADMEIYIKAGLLDKDNIDK